MKQPSQYWIVVYLSAYDYHFTKTIVDIAYR